MNKDASNTKGIFPSSHPPYLFQSKKHTFDTSRHKSWGIIKHWAKVGEEIYTYLRSQMLKQFSHKLGRKQLLRYLSLFPSSPFITVKKEHFWNTTDFLDKRPGVNVIKLFSFVTDDKA
jgi:hypothetical protein